MDPQQQQIQQLIAAVQSLTNEVQQLQQDNTSLRQQQQHASQQIAQQANISRIPHCSEVPPGPLPGGQFDGNPHRVKEFLEACAVQFAFKEHFFHTDRDRVGYMVSQMVGPALAWVTPLVTNNNPLLDSYTAFCNSVRTMFGRQEIRVASQEHLLDLKQGNLDILAYITKFKQIASDTTWSDDARGHIILEGFIRRSQGRGVQSSTSHHSHRVHRPSDADRLSYEGEDD
ncbi:protein LDOC1-like [Ambystoma mexicanum]|uniref:protein LDOC1-like n=1 Tax=Ambystoma mexicanum TaxID=8296 RepID=UPI0037E70D2A